MKSVLYCIASWSGPRSAVNFDDTYLEKHIEQLKKVKNNLTQISIGNPDNLSKRQDFENYVQSLKEVSGVPVVVHNMPNIGRSYGQWSRIYDTYRTKFDYYIFIEDDYQPVLDNFDQILVDMCEERKCGFLCGLIFDRSGRYAANYDEHAGITNGIASSQALEIVRNKFNCLPHDTGEYSEGQVLFSQGFIKAGLTLGEYIDTGEYRSVYYAQEDKFRVYGNNINGKDIFSPKQAVERTEFDFVQIKESDRVASIVRKQPKSRVIGRRR